MHSDTDDGMRRGGTMEAMAAVKTLEEGGTITAANASQISDGASGAAGGQRGGAQALGLTPLARISTSPSPPAIR